MEPITTPDGFVPSDWYVVFHTRSSRRWLSWLAMGRFKHVSAFAYVPGFKAWLIYDVQWSGTQLALLPHPAGLSALMGYTAGCEIIKMTRRRGGARGLGFFCTTSIAHLLGLRCVALVRPDALYRCILRHGGEIIGDKHEAKEHSAGGDSEAVIPI